MVIEGAVICLLNMSISNDVSIQQEQEKTQNSAYQHQIGLCDALFAVAAAAAAAAAAGHGHCRRENWRDKNLTERGIEDLGRHTRGRKGIDSRGPFGTEEGRKRKGPWG